MNVALPVLSDPPERVRGCCEPVAPPLPAEEAARLAELFKAVADPARLQIMHILKSAEAPVCVCDFTAALEQGQPTVSHHLARLKEAGLIVSHKSGVWSFYALRPDLTGPARTIINLIP
ncbi:MAG TPA: metalloregulator ArsR/SmtB family transcription factor [Chloroflexota bacterium]|jgi:ArsR family transcriptional regulator|nr:metalloregulator ArsR/SmtB family transcription factor [Chloroflexota bacterium]